MTDCGTSGRAAAIERFAASLRELRTAAGTPSFREMAGRSHAISHTTLHEAAQGNRLPSWPTVVEFVKACDGDPAAFRPQWQDANREVRAAADAPTDDPKDGPTDAAADAPADASTDAPTDDPTDDSAHPAGGWSRRTQLIAGAVVVVVAAALTVAIVLASGGSDGGPGPSATAGLTARDCPVVQTNPPPAPPTNKGDGSAYVSDVSLPDCTPVGTNRTVRKVWRLKNVGTRTWAGYELRRIGPPQGGDDCQTITEVPVPRTGPGRLVDIGVEVTTPPEPVFCVVRFKMIDASGRLAFPGSRPINFQLVVR